VTGALRRPVMAYWVCRECEVGGSDIETPHGPVRCWQCEDEVIVTARIVQTGRPIIAAANTFL
jgi:uracil phosphoribosyltransferase